MELTYLDGENLYNSFVSGAKEVIKNRIDLNNINVFPVADGDTGNNLASTMNAIIMQSKVTSSATNTMNSIADAALTGARGNSGIIMAQYINGIYMGIKDQEIISIHSFAESVKNAVPHAYNAISNPVEGTIITVIREWAEAVYKMKDSALNFNDLLKNPMDQAFISLKETSNMMKILEKAKVVDSGAKGFVHFIKGFTEFIRTGKIQEETENLEVIFEEGEIIESEPTFRYCTEALIVNDNDIDLEVIKDDLRDIGDSLIVAGNSKKARIHIHTDYPQDVMSILRNRGIIIQQKADDMRRQYEASFVRKSKIALVTDSIADLPQEFMDKHQIHMIPLNIIVGESSYLDKVTMTPDIFYDLVERIEEYPSSAQPSPKVVENLYSTLLRHYNEIIVITVASVQSGTNSVFKKVAEEMAAEGKRIEVIDSRQNSGAEGLLVLKAAELIEDGRSLDDIISIIEKLRERTKILVSVDTLKYMVRSGRLSKLSGIAGKIVNLKPVVSLDEQGKGKIEDKAFSNKSNINKIVNIVNATHNKDRVSRYSIVHANDEEKAEELKNKIKNVLGLDPEYIMNISTIVGMSAGEGSVAVAFMSEGGL